MATDTQAPSETGPTLKITSGWFAAGASFRRAMTMLSDGAFKLFVYLSLEADRRTGCCKATQTQLAGDLGKSRRIIGKYIAELEREGICTISSGKNQYAPNTFELLDDYWPYNRRDNAAKEMQRQEINAYVAAVRDKFLETGYTRGKFSIGDERRAKALKAQGVSLELLQDALLMGACRKYDSWLNGGSPEPIGSLRYFEALISEIQSQPFPQGYRQYLQSKVPRLARMWQEMKNSIKQPKINSVVE